MNPFIRPVSFNETSMRINLLHKALKTFGYAVSEKEEKSHTAGESTLKQVRAVQAKLNIKFDEKYVVDQITYEAMLNEMIKQGHTRKPNSFVVRGKVYNQRGETIKRQRLIAFDVDLAGAAVYRQVKSLNELMKHGGFEYLSKRKSDSNGNYYIEFFDFQFAAAERKKADVIVYAIDDKEKIIGRSRIVNSEEYSGKGEVANLHVLITKKEKRTEYEILMGKLNPFLKESKVKLIELSDSKDQVKFTSGELDESEIKIQIAVDAESLCNKKKDGNTGKKKGKQKNEIGCCECEKLPHELLYGIGRQSIPLNWLVLYKKTDAEIKAAISKSVKSQIIKEFSEKEIELFLRIIHTCAAEHALTYKGENQEASLAEKLSLVLPKQEQQSAFINAYRSFKNQAEKENIDIRKFWSEYLPSQREFKENPELIPALLLNQQLIILTGNHLPLMEVLQANNKISAVTQLLDYSDENWNELINKTGVPEYMSGNSDVEKKANYIGQLQSFINAAYPTQKIELMLTKNELPLKDANAAKSIKTFLSQNEKFEIGKTPVHEYADELKKAAGENYKSAKKELNRMQRVFQVSTSPKVMSVLMEKNLNSAYAITNFSKKNFVKMHSAALGGERTAEAVYQRAEHVSTLATERAMKMYELSHLAAPAYAFSKSDREEVVALMQEQVSKKHNPDYSEIFGSPDLCECEHCRSIYGAAAYFVDLLQFLAKSVKNDDFVSPETEGKSPLDVFKLRRPDLLNLPLTCENTNTLIPYIDLVNEVMEYYTCHGTMQDVPADSAAYDTGDTTADELRAAPQNFKIDAYEILKDAVYPFNLPYHQPLDVIRTYSDHLKTERYDVMKGMQVDFTAPAVKAIESEALRISQEEFKVLTGKEFDITHVDSKQLQEYYGFPVSLAPDPTVDPVVIANLEKLAGIGISDGIHEFLRRSGIKYTDLVELIKTRFINPYQNILEYLERLFVDSTLNASAIYSKLQLIDAGTLNPATDPDLMVVLTAASIAPADFVVWVQDNLDNFNAVITLYQSNSNSLCDLNTTTLKTVQNVYSGSLSSGITNSTWSKIHRFIRLWRKLGWTIHEVDLMLAALGENDITEVTINKLSYAVILNKKLKLPLNKLATIWGSIDTYGDKSLYKKLFLNKAVQRIDNAFEADEFGKYLTDTSQVLRDNTLVPPVDHVPAMLAAFRMSEDDLNAIIEVVNVNTVTTNTAVLPNTVTHASRKLNLATDKLNIYNLTLIYGYTVLSKALKLKVPDFCSIIKLFNINPFSDLSIPVKIPPTPVEDHPFFENISPSLTFDFYELAASIKKTGFKAEVLQYIFTGILPAESKLGFDNDKIKQAVRDIRATLVTIEQNYPAIPASPLTAEILKSNLLLTFNGDVVNQIIGIIGSQQTFSITTDAIPAVVIPAPLAAKYSYDSVTGKLICSGIMPDADRIALKALSGANDNFRNAVDGLYTATKTISTGSPSYSVITTPANLPVVIPDSLSPKFIYTKANGRLTCTGIMSDAEKIELKALAGANANFQSAVDTLYKMPEDFIKENFSGVFAVANAASANSDLISLLNHPLQPTEKTLDEKLQFVYFNYLPLLKQKSREDSTIQHIASLIGLSNEATRILIKDDLQSLIESIASEGFSAEYFPNTTFTLPSAVNQTDDEINFDFGNNVPDPALPANNFSIRWQGYISPPSSGEYNLVVDVKEADETFNLYLDDELILRKTAADPGTSWEVPAQLNASLLHKLTVEYTDTIDNAGITLSWKTATTALETIPSSAVYPAGVIDSFTASVQTLHRSSKFISGFKLTDTEVNHFVNFKSDFDNIDFKAIAPLHWQRINDYVQLRNAIPQSQALLTDVFVAANISFPVPIVDELINIAYLATAWDLNTITDLIKNYYSLSVADFKDEKKLSKIYDAVSFVLKTGLSSQTIAQWAVPETDFDKLNSTAELVKSTVKAKYEEEDWLKLAGDLSDKIRENQKQALISYLLTKQELIDWGVKDADGLFEYFLIDVQMGACMDTSRIVQANAAVQMFVQRCLLNLESETSTGTEKGVSPEYIDKDRWEWMKYYRVWEVNRKIFITPENWLEPEWRDDKSAFFKELESELTQNDITDRNVETAFRNYLTKLNTVANLDVCGMYQENNTDGTIKLLHVFGRTHNAPYQFFYRTCSGTYKWGPWEKVQLDIRTTEDGDNSGVHLVPVVWKDRLFLFWTEFIEKQEETHLTDKNGNEVSFETISKQAPSSIKPKKYWEIRIAWSEYIETKWTSKQLTKEYLKIYSDTDTSPVKNLMIKSELIDNLLYIIPLVREVSNNRWREKGKFKIFDIQSQLATQGGSTRSFSYESVSRYANNFEKHKLYSTLELWDNTYLQNPVTHNLVFSNDVMEKEATPDSPFFYHDKDRTYFVKPDSVSIWQAGRYPELYFPLAIELVENANIAIASIPKVGPDDYLPEDFFDGGFTVPSPELINITGGLMEEDFSGRKLMSKTISHNAKMVHTASAAKKTNAAVESGLKDNVLEYSRIKEAFATQSYGYEIYEYYRYLLTEKGLEFNTFYHPYSSKFVSNLNTDGIKGLMDSNTLRNDTAPNLLIYNDSGSKFTTNYNPDFYNPITKSGYVKKAPDSENYDPLGSYTLYKENICFDMYGANSGYNWELFYHIPLYIATRLSKNGRYEEAMKWFHYIFDPTTDEQSLPGETPTARYWKTLPFKTTPTQSIEAWFASIGSIDKDHNGENDIIQEWRDNPFKPFLVARNRPLAFMKNVVIKYVENLREWGDSLFRVFQREQVYEALQLYVMANHILGPRPEFVPKRGEIKAETYTSLIAKTIDDFSNASVELENIFPYSSSVSVSGGTSTPGLLGIGPALYFCIPSNEKLMEHWDTVADRLYKIRHCMDIDGVKRQLALFAPPIDPAMLINAAAQGLSLGSILSDLSSPPPIYRFNYLIQKANEFCAEVKSLGSTLLSALEKKDGEELGRLRASHETMMLDLMSEIKERQVLDAKANKEGLLKSRETATFRLKHYFALLSEESIDPPSAPTIDANINSESQLPGDTSIAKIETDVDESLVDSDEGGVKLIPREKQQIEDSLNAVISQGVATAMEGLAGILHLIPSFAADVKPFGVGAGLEYGGPQLGSAISGLAKVPQIIASIYSHNASQAAQMASYIRREQDWTLQANLAAKEIIQLDKQIVSADIKIQISEKELFNHKQQIENSKQVEQFLKDKFTNQELYQWLKEQLFSVYKQSFNMAYDMAKKVEKCYQYELGIEPTNFIQYGYWDNTMQGLCAGEKLQLALKQLEKSYIEENKRELELTKSVSMALLNPLALQELRITGKCFLTIPEELYDLDYQGHYFRRIKSVSISLPCIAGPYTTVNCTLRLLKNTVRINTSPSSDEGLYQHQHEVGIWVDDDRFRESNVPVKAIASSTGQRDSGMFELSFNDPRYLPFEGAGAISEWKIELTQDVDLRQFDYSTISDVILHISYTAREDAGLFKESAVTYLKDFLINVDGLSTQPLISMFSMKHEFSSEWHKFLYPAIAGSDQTLSVTLKKENFPFFTKDRSINLKKMEVLMKANRTGEYKMLLTAMESDDTALNSSEISMPENGTYANMQKANLTFESAGTAMINVEEMDVFKPMTLKLKHNSDGNYHSIDIAPEEISDLFVIFHYYLGDLI